MLDYIRSIVYQCTQSHAIAEEDMDYIDRIAIQPGKRGGRPVIRGLRITVYDVLGWLADGMTDN